MLCCWILHALGDSSCSFVSILSVFQDVLKMEMSQDEVQRGENLGYTCVILNTLPDLSI